MKVAIFGATGMVGMGALLECLDDPRIHAVLAIVRRSTGIRDPKVSEIIHADFFSYDSLDRQLAGCDACFFCLGVSSLGKDEATYHRWTYDLTLAAARAMLAANPRLIFCYVSGQGTDSSERGRVMWARVKGKTENALLRMSFQAAYMLRPGFIQPLRGVRSRTGWYNVFYTVLGPLSPVFRRLFPSHVTTTVDVGRTLIQLASVGGAQHILETADINRLAAAGRRRSG